MKERKSLKVPKFSVLVVILKGGKTYKIPIGPEIELDLDPSKGFQYSKKNPHSFGIPIP